MQLRNAFVSSINGAGITNLTATPGPGNVCFTINFPQAFQFFEPPLLAARSLPC